MDLKAYYFAPFIIPFVAGALAMLFLIVWKWGHWFMMLTSDDKRLIRKGIFTRATWQALGESVMECLFHRRIWRINPVLGYMHTSLALGWFLLIVVGWVEASSVLGAGVPLHAHVFFRYFDPSVAPTAGNTMSVVMDALLLWVLSGVALAWIKRMRSRLLGMRKATRHTPFDRMALASLWFVFPLRLVSESLMAAIKHNGGFMTQGLGNLMSDIFPAAALPYMNEAAWWLYSMALALFFVSMPFSRYMHIFTEVPLIFLRHYRLRTGERQGGYDMFQIHACSRCGICIDPCQLQRSAGIDSVQSVYFVRDRRNNRLTDAVVDNCLMCGRCQTKCPVGLDLNALRLNSRILRMNNTAGLRYDYLEAKDPSVGQGHVGYFAGCMTLLTPAVLQSMQTIFDAAGESVWWADRDGGVCCGRPLKLSGEVDAARRMMQFNSNLFRTHGITTLVTSCPICLKVFKEDYHLDGIEILHHSEYILRLMAEGRIAVHLTQNTFTYHDPCELGRGGGIYEAPREVIAAVGRLIEPRHNRQEALCCGSSVADTAISDEQQRMIGSDVVAELSLTGAERIVTACPLCKKALGREAPQRVVDLSQIIAENLVKDLHQDKN